MFNGVERKGFDGLKAVLSVAAIAAGLLLSSMAGPDFVATGDGSTDIVGLWRWVVESPGENEGAADVQLFEIQRDFDGRLTARMLSRDRANRHADTRVSYDEGQVCVVAGDGTSFKGQVSDDGSRIEGVIRYQGSHSAAQLRRVDRRKLRAAERRTYAT
jgi:hypothetical protein